MTPLLSIVAMSVFIYITPMAGTEKTVQNLKEAYIGESNASAKYFAYAAQAKKEGFTRIATLFEATSKAEAIHAANHRTVLEKLGTKPDELKIIPITPKITKENLEDAIKGETHEVKQMYSEFIKVSRTENATGATKSFTWANDTEKKHITLYNTALNALNLSKEASLSTVCWVCPKCGNTYNATTEKNCSLCQTSSSKFIKFGK